MASNSQRSAYLYRLSVRIKSVPITSDSFTVVKVRAAKGKVCLCVYLKFVLFSMLRMDSKASLILNKLFTTVAGKKHQQVEGVDHENLNHGTHMVEGKK